MTGNRSVLLFQTRVSHVLVACVFSSSTVPQQISKEACDWCGLFVVFPCVGQSLSSSFLQPTDWPRIVEIIDNLKFNKRALLCSDKLIALSLLVLGSSSSQEGIFFRQRMEDLLLADDRILIPSLSRSHSLHLHCPFRIPAFVSACFHRFP